MRKYFVFSGLLATGITGVFLVNAYFSDSNLTSDDGDMATTESQVAARDDGAKQDNSDGPEESSEPVTRSGFDIEVHDGAQGDMERRASTSSSGRKGFLPSNFEALENRVVTAGDELSVESIRQLADSYDSHELSSLIQSNSNPEAQSAAEEFRTEFEKSSKIYNNKVVLESVGCGDRLCISAAREITSGALDAYSKEMSNRPSLAKHSVVEYVKETPNGPVRYFFFNRKPGAGVTLPPANSDGTSG